MFFRLFFFALAVAVSAAPFDAEPPIKFACHLSQDPGKQICRHDDLTLSVQTSNALPIDLEIEKAELTALIKSWTPTEGTAVAALHRPKRQFGGFGGGLAGSSSQAASGSFAGGFGGGGFPGGFYPGGGGGGGFGSSNSYASSGSNAFGGGLGGFGR